MNIMSYKKDQVISGKHSNVHLFPCHEVQWQVGLKLAPLGKEKTGVGTVG